MKLQIKSSMQIYKIFDECQLQSEGDKTVTFYYESTRLSFACIALRCHFLLLNQKKVTKEKSSAAEI